jgi:hypothetical protein
VNNTQRRKLQRLRLLEKRGKEVEKQRDEVFNTYRPMVPQGKEWRVNTTPRQRWSNRQRGRFNRQRRLDRVLQKHRSVSSLQSP